MCRFGRREAHWSCRIYVKWEEVKFERYMEVPDTWFVQPDHKRMDEIQCDIKKL
jgi:hypothetical protein